MKITALDRLASFALLGPGFGDGQWLLLQDLRAEGEYPRLVYARFEADGSRPLVLSAAEMTSVEPEFDEPRQPLVTSIRDDGYREHVERIRAAIAQGDVYQVCYTVPALIAATSGPELLSLMCRRGVPRFAAWVRLPNGEELVSASPELFFETEGRHVHSEPMKGTAARNASGELQASEKERCELAMITDLIRNDLTPICLPHSVRVACERRIIELPYALQTVSDVVGELRPEVTLHEILAALHPGGSVTGAPKQAALTMIRELEPEPRGAYCGTLGLVDQHRSRFSLLIRTAQRRNDAWVYGVGGGIVYDSDPTAEHREIRIKLGALNTLAADETA